MEPDVGLEPTACRVQTGRTTDRADPAGKPMMENERIELSFAPCGGAVLPLYEFPEEWRKNKDSNLGRGRSPVAV